MSAPRLSTRVASLSLLAAAITIAATVDAQSVFPRVGNYEAHELTLDGSGCRVTDIHSGIAVGWCNTPDGSSLRAFAWREETGVVDLGTLGGASANAFGTRLGRVVGSSNIADDSASHAFAWTPLTGMIDLGSLGGTFARGNAVSGSVVVGVSATVEEQLRPFRWTPSTGIVALPLLPGGTEGNAHDIDGALIAGYSTTATPGRRPVVWRTDGTLIDPLGEPIESCGVFVCGDGDARAVREGLVVGYRRNESEENRAFAWTQAQGLIEIGVVPGANESFAFDTDGRLVVGQLSGTGGPLGFTTRAFVWNAADGIRAITPTTIAAFATHVAAGRVVGVYSSPETNGQRAFLWTARRGLVDVTSRRLPSGAPAGIDDEGRIAVVYEDENPLNTRSVVMVPR